MLFLKLEKENDEKVVFNYFPEKKDEYGTLEINKKDGSIEIIKVADTDEFQRYLHKAVMQMTKYYENSYFEKESTIAWY